ncbi:conserved virulence factor C family protein [Virgibacillus sp. W0181]|uniref:conserved virulence factor C family protein n=1 Tax=Virgibacillus sp. W0181 TaxID=3391581 RepID=UPI003F466997
MKIVSIEPTPSPHSMKVNLDESLPDGETYNYQSKDEGKTAPPYINKLLQIDGVKGLYHVLDFITIQRNPRIKWEEILPEVRELLGATGELTENFIAAGNPETAPYGEVKVFLQMFRNIPMQVKLEDGDTELRFGLPEIFTNAVMEASKASSNMLMERKWVEQSTRYGDMKEIGDTVVEELVATYDENRLSNLVKRAFSNEDKVEETTAKPKEKVTMDILESPNWKERYAALDLIVEPTTEDLDVLNKALDDEKSSVRRLATALLGMIEDPEVLPFLYKALKDKAVNVRRTAGDCLSDLGLKEAMPEMTDSLKDTNRLVRWRAAMFLYELGDKTAIPALKQALDDPEFEVRMQVQMALARIEGGKKAQGSIWQQMNEATKKD